MERERQEAPQGTHKQTRTRRHMDERGTHKETGAEEMHTRDRNEERERGGMAVRQARLGARQRASARYASEQHEKQSSLA